MKGKILRLAGIMFLLNFLNPSFISAELTNFNAEIIKIAFLNGYVNALDADIETIKNIKEDKNKMKKYSDIAVKNYLAKVNELNREDLNNYNENKKDATNSYWSKGW